jgi:hypothetical protein
MTWDKTKPVGTETWTQGSAFIREWRADTETALNTDGVFPVVAAAPSFIHKFKYGVTGSRPTAAYAGRLYYNSTTETIQRDNGASWDNITPPKNIIPTALKLVFYNSSAPTGWTQDTTWNDSMIRITSGAGEGTGGTDSISNPPTHDHTAVTENPDIDLSHIHTIVANITEEVAISFNRTGLLPGIYNTNSSGDLDHTHTVTTEVGYAPKYANVIVCYR